MQYFGGGSSGSQRSAREELAESLDDANESADKANLKSDDDAAVDRRNESILERLKKALGLGKRR